MFMDRWQAEHYSVDVMVRYDVKLGTAEVLIIDFLSQCDTIIN